VAQPEDAQPIVVGIDGSPGAQHALEWAVAECAVRAAPLVVVHAWEPPAPVSGLGSILDPLDVQPYEHHAAEVLAAAFTNAVSGLGTEAANIVPVLERGYPPTRLLDAAKGAQLLVLGTRGRGGFRGLLLGAVGQHCSLHATTAVAVIPDAATLRAGGEVVVGVDGSEGARAALCWAVEEAVKRSAELCVVHAWRFDAATAPADYRYAAINRDTFLRQSHAMVQRELERAIAQVGVSPVTVDPVSVDQPPVQALVGRAGRDGLLVVGSRGRGGFAGLLLGSVSQHCLHHARGAVVVVPDPK
jgi:nucleotide-binding universal stress UspA family protein